MVVSTSHKRMKRLVCVEIGHVGEIVVRIDPTMRVYELKEIIKQKNGYACAARDLQLYLAKKGGAWLKVTDPVVQQLKEGIIPGQVSDVMKNEMQGMHSVDDTAFGLPDQDATNEEDIHVLVRVPVSTSGATTLWQLRGSIPNALTTAGVRCPLYRLAMTHRGCYDPGNRTDGKDKALWYDGTTLYIHILFETKADAWDFRSALQFQRFTIGSSLHGLECTVQVDPFQGDPNFLQEILLEHYVPGDSESPEGTVSSSSSSRVTIVDMMTDEFQYQRIESAGVFGTVGKAESCHLMSREHCRHHASYRKYDHDKSNRLALSWDMRGWYDGLSCEVPAFNLRIDSVSESPTIDNRYEVKLIVQPLDAQYGRLIAGRLKEGSSVSPDFLEMRTFVHVEDSTVFRACLEWKARQIDREWDDYFSMTPAAD